MPTDSQEPVLTLAPVLAVVDLGQRAGGRGFEIGYLRDDPADPGWWMYVQYPGARIQVDGHHTPRAAADALAGRILDGGRCRCGRVATTRNDSAVIHPGATMATGQPGWTEAEARAAGACRWRRYGRRWEPSCPDPADADQPTRERLARVLDHCGLDEAILARAREGYYDDFASPLAMPCLQLVSDLETAGYPELAARARDGEWDATPDESAAWAASPEGREAHAEFGPLLADQPTAGSPPRPPPAVRARQQRRRHRGR